MLCLIILYKSDKFWKKDADSKKNKTKQKVIYDLSLFSLFLLFFLKTVTFYSAHMSAHQLLVLVETALMMDLLKSLTLHDFWLRWKLTVVTETW